MAFTSVLAVCMLAMPVQFAYALSDGSSVSVGGNGVGAEYIAVDLYVKDGSAYVPASENSFSAGTLGYTASTSGGGTTYSIPADTTIELSCSDLYVIVNSSDTERTYELSGSVVESGTFNVTGCTYSLTSGGQDIDGLEAVPGTPYPVVLTMTFRGYSAVNVEPVLPKISVTLSVIDTATSTVLDSTNVIDAQVIAHYQTVDDAEADMMDKNDTDENGAFTGNDGETYYIQPGNSTGTTTSVYISDSENGTSISKPGAFFGTDPFDADVVIPAGQSFIVAVTLNHAWLAAANITVSLTVGDATYSSGSITSTGKTYVFHASGSNLSTSTSLSNVTWMQYAGNVTITVAGSTDTILGSASIDVEIVFQK